MSEWLNGFAPDERAIWLSAYGAAHFALAVRKDLDPDSGAWYAANKAVDGFRREALRRMVPPAVKRGVR